MRPWLKRWGWPIFKGVLALAILAGVAWQFARDLRRTELNTLEFRWPWLALSAVTYVTALGFSALFWFRLLRIFGQHPTALPILRAYYIGQLGKYVPGKAWALLLRGGLVHGPQVHFGAAVLTAFYEVLTTMATGALVAAIVFVFQPPPTEGLEWHPLYTGLLLLGLLGLPLLPGVFNLLTARLARRFPMIDSLQTPKMTMKVLAEGVLTTALGWGLFGVSLWTALAAVLPEVPDLTLDLWLQLVGSIGLSYVAGFLVLVVPGGVGVREYFLSRLLAFVGPLALIDLAVLLMRLAWTTAELLAAGGLQLLAMVAKTRADTKPGSA